MAVQNPKLRRGEKSQPVARLETQPTRETEMESEGERRREKEKREADFSWLLICRLGGERGEPVAQSHTRRIMRALSL